MVAGRELTIQSEQVRGPVHGLDGAEPQARQGGARENGVHQILEARSGVEVASPAGEVDAGEHELLAATDHKTLHALEADFEGDGAAVAARCGNDAEGAAVPAAVLH